MIFIDLMPFVFNSGQQAKLDEPIDWSFYYLSNISSTPSAELTKLLPEPKRIKRNHYVPVEYRFEYISFVKYLFLFSCYRLR